jgi:hypothetical protein
MDENVLIKVALICVVVGMGLVLVMTEFVDLDVRVDVGSMPRGSDVKISGRVSFVRSGNVSLFTVVQSIPVVVFENVSVREGMDVVVYGIVEEYDGVREVIASEVLVK